MGKNYSYGIWQKGQFFAVFFYYSSLMVKLKMGKQSVYPRNFLATMAVLWFFSSSAIADTRWFQVELIVFAQNSTNTERFDQTTFEIEWPHNVIGLTASRHSLESLKQNPVSYSRLVSGDMHLHGAYNQISRKAGFRPLLYVSWLQSVQGKGLSNAVHIHSSAGPNGEYPLNGYVRIKRGHYLHLLVDMEYSPDLANGYNEDNDSLVYHLKEKRRIQLNEIHYFDHPKFGVIAKLKPITIGQ